MTLTIAPGSKPEHTRFPTGPVQERILNVESVYYYYVREYKPPVAVATVDRQSASIGTPEDATIALLNAMIHGDHEWWLSLWRQPERSQQLERDKAAGRTRDTWKRAWERAFAGQSFELRHRIDTGDYAIVTYRQVGQDRDQRVILKRESDQWRATQELASDPVLQFLEFTEPAAPTGHSWTSPTLKPRAANRGVPKKKNRRQWCALSAVGSERRASG